MFMKVQLQATCVVCLTCVFGSGNAEVCTTADGLMFSSTEETVSKFSRLSTGCWQSQRQAGIKTVSLHESPQLKLYDGDGVASKSLASTATASSLIRHYSPDQFYSVSISHSSFMDTGLADEVSATAEDFNIDPLLLHAIAHVESRHNPDAVSPAGARGLMQVMPGTARQFGMTNPEQELFDPVENLRVSSTYLRSLYDIFGNNLELVLAAYNAGESAVIRYGYQVPPYAETQQYVRMVLEKYQELMQSATAF